MDDPNIIMKEYIRIEEEKARRRGKVFNWETATYEYRSTNPTMKITRGESVPGPCTHRPSHYGSWPCPKSLPYVNDLKTNSKNNSDKVNMPLLPSPEPTVSYYDDLDFFKDFENEFPAIVYNDAPTSKSDFLAEPTL
nr:hypothetical protein [Tanacetum cinerariifolium]